MFKNGELKGVIDKPMHVFGEIALMSNPVSTAVA